MVVKKTLALTLMFVAVSCSSYTQPKKHSRSLGPTPSWVSEMLVQRKIDKSFEHLKSRLSLHPENIWQRMTLARIYAVKKLYRLSELEYEKILKSQGQLPEPLMDLGSIFLHTKEYEKALFCLKGLGNSNEHLMYNRSLIQMERGQELLALKAINRSLELDDKNEEAMELKAILLIKLRRYSKAEDMMIYLIKKYPQNEFANKNLDWMKHSGKKVSGRYIFSLLDTHSLKYRDWSGQSWSPEVSR